MRGGVMLRGFFGVMFGLDMMAMRQMGMVGGLLVIALFVMLSGVFVVLRSVFMVLRGVAMMIGVFLRHGTSSLWRLRNLRALQRYQYRRGQLQGDCRRIAMVFCAQISRAARLAAVLSIRTG